MADQQKKIIAGLQATIELRDNAITALEQENMRIKIDWAVACKKLCEKLNDKEADWNTHNAELVARIDEVEQELASAKKAQLENTKKLGNAVLKQDKAEKKVANLQAKLAAVKEDKKTALELSKINREIGQAHSAKLKEFARCVITDWCWGSGSMDGCDMQEFAERFGLIVKFIATESDLDEEDDFEVGDERFKFTQVLESEVTE